MRTFNLTDDQVDAIVVYELESYLRASRVTKNRLQGRIDAGERLEEFERTDLSDAYRIVAALEIVLDGYRVKQ